MALLAVGVILFVTALVTLVTPHHGVPVDKNLAASHVLNATAALHFRLQAERLNRWHGTLCHVVLGRSAEGRWSWAARGRKTERSHKQTTANKPRTALVSPFL